MLTGGREVRAVVFEGKGKLTVTNLPDPTPGEKDVVIEVAAVGMCGTDIHVYDGEFEGGVFPIIPGHEISGKVVAVGSAVKNLRVGDLVAGTPTLTCEDCEYCLTGRSNLCRNWQGMGVVANDGASAEFLRAPARNCHKLQPGTDLNHAALIEPLACAVRGFDVLPREMGSHYLIYGAGTMGLLMAQLARRAGAVSISVVDTNAKRLEAARAVGVEHTFANADESNRKNWEVVIDCTGVVAAIEDGLPRVKPGGTFQNFGVAPVEARAKYSPFRIYRDEVSVVGTMATVSCFGRAVDLFEAGAINPAPMISHFYSLDDYATAMDMFRAGTGRKLQIRPSATQSGTLLSL